MVILLSQPAEYWNYSHVAPQLSHPQILVGQCSGISQPLQKCGCFFPGLRQHRRIGDGNQSVHSCLSPNISGLFLHWVHPCYRKCLVRFQSSKPNDPKSFFFPPFNLTVMGIDKTNYVGHCGGERNTKRWLERTKVCGKSKPTNEMMWALQVTLVENVKYLWWSRWRQNLAERW